MVEAATPINGSRCEEPLLLWAVRSRARNRLVHIGMLGKDENGAKCKCICHACAQPVLAVNVDKPASHFQRPGTQRKHFKHAHRVDEERRCLSKIAQQIALQVFVEQGVVFLPSRAPKVSSRGALKVVHVSSAIQEEQVKVRSQTWVDDQTAMLELVDGRIVIVTVRSTHSIDDQSGNTCVLSLARVTDPALACMSSDEILERLRLPGAGMHWASHWNDLRGDEQGIAKENEDEILGGIPEELLEGLDGKQASETLLHWLIKKAISEHSLFEVPAYEVPVAAAMPDGSQSIVMAKCPAMTLDLVDVRLEKRLGTMVPDVVCVARQVQGKLLSDDIPGVPFIIEAAVTHRIDSTKHEKILESGMGCIEIDANRFRETGRVPASEICTEVVRGTLTKKWIVHPWIADEIKRAQRTLELRYRNMQSRLAAVALENQLANEREAAEQRQRQEEIRNFQEWVESSSDLILAKGYHKVLAAKWLGKPTPRLGNLEIDKGAIWQEIQRRGLATKDLNRPHLHEEILKMLHQINCAADQDQLDMVVRNIGSPAHVITHMRHHLLVLFYALDDRRSSMGASTQQYYDEARTVLNRQLESGEFRLARSQAFDGLICLLHPKLARRLQSPVGTEAELRVARERALFKAELETKQAQEAKERELAQASAKRQRETRRAERNATVMRGRTRQLLQSLKGHFTWLSSISEPPNVGLLYALYGGRCKLPTDAVIKALKTAIEFRGQRQSVVSAIDHLKLNSPDEVHSVLALWTAAKLCQRVASAP